MTVLPHNPHRIRTPMQKKKNTHTHARAIARKVSHKRAGRAHTCAPTDENGGGGGGGFCREQRVIKISVVSFRRFLVASHSLARHKIVHCCLRLASASQTPHFREGGGLINKSNHHNQWPQSLQSSLASTLLLAVPPAIEGREGGRGGGWGRFGAGKSAHWRLSI